MSGHAYAAAALRTRDARPERPRPGVARPLGLAGLCLAALALVWLIAEHVPAVQLRDASALYHFTLLNRPRVESVGSFLLELLSPLVFLLWGLALVSVALARERPRHALAVIAVMILAPLTAQTLKPLVAVPHRAVGGVHIGPASWPSGHAAAALALVLCALLVAPARVRPLIAALGGAFAAAVGLALLILAWHMPSDVLGGYLVATLWMALAVAALRAAERRWPPHTAALSASAGPRG